MCEKSDHAYTDLKTFCNQGHILIIRRGKENENVKKFIIDGNAVYEIDEKCMLKKKLGELKEKKITSDEKRAEQSVVTGKPNRLKR